MPLKLLARLFCAFGLSIGLLFLSDTLEADSLRNARTAQGTNLAQALTAAEDADNSYEDCIHQAQTGQHKYGVNWKQCLEIMNNMTALLEALGAMGANQASGDAVNPIDMPDFQFGGLPDPGGITYNPPGTPDIPGALFDVCERTPNLCRFDCSGSDCVPVFQAPLENNRLLQTVARGIQNGTIDTGILSPEDYLFELANGLEKTTSALTELNNLARGSDFSNVDTSTAELAALNEELLDSSQRDMPDSEGSRAVAEGDSNDWLPFDFNFDGLFKKKKEERPERGAVSVLGGEILEQKSGKKLNIFERMTRALKGPENTRDLLLARQNYLIDKALRLAQQNESRQRAAAVLQSEDTELDELKTRSPASTNTKSLEQAAEIKPH